MSLGSGDPIEDGKPWRGFDGAQAASPWAIPVALIVAVWVFVRRRLRRR